MTVTVAPQDSLNMSQAQWLEVETSKWTNGVLSGRRNTFTVTTTSGLGTSVNTGDGLVQGFGFWSDAAVTLTCAAADPTNPRIDRAVLHADLSAHTGTIILLTGTPAPSPVPPTLTQTATVWEVSLYQVRVNAGQTTLTGGSLTDERTYATPNVAPGAIGTAQIANAAITTALIATGAVGSTQILDGSIATVDIANGAITTALIANAAITTALIADANVTDAKMATQKVSRTGDTMSGALTAPAFHGVADNVPASGVQAGALPGGVGINVAPGTAQFTSDRIGVSLRGGTLSGIDSTGTVGLQADANIIFSLHCYRDGSNVDRFTGASNAVQIFIDNSGLNLRTSQNAASANTAITWNPVALQIDTGGYTHSDVLQAIDRGYVGFKNSSGTKLAEFSAGGACIVSGGNPCFLTTAATVGFAASSSFDTFDYAEAFATDDAYDAGMVVCPAEDGRMHRCTHDSCYAALVVSKAPGMALGGGKFSDDETPSAPQEPHEWLAVAGRVRVVCDSDIAFRQLVTSDGTGGVRAMAAGEEGFALGYALHSAQDGMVGVLIRPMYCTAPAR